MSCHICPLSQVAKIIKLFLYFVTLYAKLCGNDSIADLTKVPLRGFCWGVKEQEKFKFGSKLYLLNYFVVIDIQICKVLLTV